ncbi:MAG: PD-(D/E)XK nuclease family protein [Acidobacteriota bacterium]
MMATLRIGHGAQAVEAALLAALDAHGEEARREPTLLARPVRVIVPSRSLRLHLSAQVVAAPRRPALGLRVQTLFATALEVLERSGDEVPRGALLFDLLTRRLAREEPLLAQVLDDLVDGYRGVAATVRDLLDAGFEAVHGGAAEEALGSAATTRLGIDRGRALIRIAGHLLQGAEALGLGRSGHLLARATERLAAAPELLPSRAVHVHGFADATGRATDFLEVLLRQPRASLWLDLPPDPATLEEPEPNLEEAFPSRLRERLGNAPESSEGTADRPHLELFDATALDAEVRELVRRIRDLLAAGECPEGIAIVVRNGDLYRLPLRRHLRALAVPFSGLDLPGSLTPDGRRQRALVDLLRRGTDLPADRWLDATLELGDRPLKAQRRMDLRLAFFALGAGRLRDIAELEIDRYLHEDAYGLPLRQGLRPGASLEAKDDGEAPDGTVGPSRAVRRWVSGFHLRAAIAAARDLGDRLAEWPARAPAGRHLGRLQKVLRESLGWRRDATLEHLWSEVPNELVLTFDEFRALLAPLYEGGGYSALGGSGGGVQVLTVTEARGRTFEHLFVAGLNRGVFPRTVREDPLLPDDLRTTLQGVLPDIPLKGRGFEEERYLFAQLLSASPRVTLSWTATGADDRALARSPLVERLLARWGSTAPRVARADGLFTMPGFAAREPTLRPAREHTILAALHGSRESFRRLLPVTMAESRQGWSAHLAEPSTDAWAAARFAILQELDPDRRSATGRSVRSSLGPYFGFIGRRRPGGGDDPRREVLPVTTLEGIASCPWQVFLERLLRVEPTPDPIQSLPDIDPLILGNVVHRVLEAIVQRAAPRLPASLATSRPEDAFLVPWPDDGTVSEILAEESERLVEEDGVALRGMARALAARARPLLDEVAASEWAEPVLTLGPEIAGEIRLPDDSGGERTVRFKADRLDPGDGGRWRLTDYKTGRPISEAKQDKTRRRHFLDQISAGRRLQGVAYALAGGAGRYFFLRPGVVAREFLVAAGDEAMEEAFGHAVRTALAAWDAGSFFPRVVDPEGRKEPILCSFCSVAEACLRGDSGARMRLHEWAEGERRDLRPAERALVDLWDLAEPARRRVEGG